MFLEEGLRPGAEKEEIERAKKVFEKNISASDRTWSGL